MDDDKTNSCLMALLGGITTLGIIALFVVVLLCASGCRSADCGSKTVVGNHTAYPKLSSDASDLDIEVYESTEGAVVYTRKDSHVEIAYTNVYTNTILGVWERRGAMTLGVTIAPCETVAESAAEQEKETDLNR